MPTSDTTITVPHQQNAVDVDAVRLAAAKVFTPTATNSHGVSIEGVSTVSDKTGGHVTSYVCRVRY